MNNYSNVITEPCSNCKGSGEIVVLKRGGRRQRTTGTEAFEKLMCDDGWEYDSVIECTECRGYGRQNPAEQ